MEHSHTAGELHDTTRFAISDTAIGPNDMHSTWRNQAKDWDTIVPLGRDVPSINGVLQPGERTNERAASSLRSAARLQPFKARQRV